MHKKWLTQKIVKISRLGRISSRLIKELVDYRRGPSQLVKLRLVGSRFKEMARFRETARFRKGLVN